MFFYIRSLTPRQADGECARHLFQAICLVDKVFLPRGNSDSFRIRNEISKLHYGIDYAFNVIVFLRQVTVDKNNICRFSQNLKEWVGTVMGLRFTAFFLGGISRE